MLGENQAGGQVVVSDGIIKGNQMDPFVEEAIRRKESVTVLTGTHGWGDGSTRLDFALTEEDIERLADRAGVHIVDVDGLSPQEIYDILEETNGMVIAGFCHSDACLAEIANGWTLGD